MSASADTAATSETRPAIGVVTALEQAHYGVWDSLCALTPYAYVQALQRAGAMVVMIPEDSALVENPDEILDRIDGLVLAGGCDIDPSSYGAVPHPETVNTVPARDAIELALARRAIARDIPVLGICRGMQLLNVARGGTLIQHLPDTVGHGEHRRNPGSFDGSDHDVALDPGSLAARAAGEEQPVIKSHHHQAVDQLGEGLVVTGRSALDQLPEALEDPERTYVLGVQWHPEADEASPVVASLVEQAREYRLARR
jgi:putative glutamine amidotransferase